MAPFLFKYCLRCKSRPVKIEEEVVSSSSNIDIELLPQGYQSKIRVRKKKFGKLKCFFPNRLFSCFRKDAKSMTKIEKTIKATLLIQKWFRRYMALLEARRIYSWSIFQSLEYMGEQDQVKLYNFFNALLTHIPQNENDESSPPSRSSSLESLDLEFDDESPDPDEEFLDPEERRSSQFKLKFPLTENDLTRLIEIFRKRRHFRLQPHVVAEILKRSTVHLKKLPNLNIASTALCKQITVCGDLHGKLDDLLVIFHKNGLPSLDNPYVFNGDFVDRGKRGLEVLLILLVCLLVYPGAIFLNRGNHEDHIMNQRYGFIKEVQSKYKRNSNRILKLIDGVFKYLPLGTVVDNKVLIVHGGISDTTDLDLIKSLDRGKYVSLLRPPLPENSPQGAEVIDKVEWKQEYVYCPENLNEIEWKQIFDILWSDPQTGNGCIPNKLRGAGTYFGPDVTKKFLENNKLHYLVRSHECKAEGYEVTHDNMVVTIFSASSYYEVGSNNGAYLKLVGPNLETHYVQYMANSSKRKLTFHQRMSIVEAGAIRELQSQIMVNKEKLEAAFAEFDTKNTGFISVTQWCECMLNVTGLSIPWRMMKEKLVTIDPETNKVKYATTFDVRNKRINSVQGASTVVETLYRNKKSLEAIFHIIDKDKSGYISLDEFSDACNLIKKHMPSPMTHEQLEEICKMMDLNKDGFVDLNEFLESFRMVDPLSRQANLTQSPELDKGNQQKQNQLLDVRSISNIEVSIKNTPPISPAVMKPLKVGPKIAEEGAGCSYWNGDNSESSPSISEKIKSDDEQTLLIENSKSNGSNKSNGMSGNNKSNGNHTVETNVQIIVDSPKEDIKKTGYVSPLQMSPTLSSRRGN